MTAIMPSCVSQNDFFVSLGQEPFLPPEGLTKGSMPNPSMSRGTRGASLSLVNLETLPCGCVSGVYRARPTVVEVELVEAKGPHCLFYRHRAGQVTRLGLPDEWETEGGEALV